MQAHQSTQLNLGTISAVSVDHNWTLEANLSVQLRARHNTPLPSSTDLLAHLKTQSAWVSRGNGLNLVVEIDPVLQLDCDAEQRRLVSALRNAVANADVSAELTSSYLTQANKPHSSGNSSTWTSHQSIHPSVLLHCMKIWDSSWVSAILLVCNRMERSDCIAWLLVSRRRI